MCVVTVGMLIKLLYVLSDMCINGPVDACRHRLFALVMVLVVVALKCVGKLLDCVVDH